jgi:V/A-type H+-transporting ATPase subunit E
VAQSDNNSQEVLCDEILADARRQAERAIRKAEREARAAIEKAKGEVEQERNVKLTEARQLAERKRMLALATLPVEIGRMQAADVERTLLSLRERILERLTARQGFDYARSLATLAAEAIERMEGDAFVMELAEADQEVYGEKLPRAVLERIERSDVQLTIAPQPASIASGVIVRDPDGRQIWDNSLAARLDRMWPLLRSQLANHLRLQNGVKTSGGQS